MAIEMKLETLEAIYVSSDNDDTTTFDDDGIQIDVTMGKLRKYVDHLSLKTFPADYVFLMKITANRTKSDFIDKLFYCGIGSDVVWKRQACAIRLVENKSITPMPKQPDCPNLVVLSIVQIENYCLQNLIPISFFNFMPALRFLDLSGIGSRKLPTSLFNCTQLQVLLVRNCRYIHHLPQEIEKLKNLEVLDLSGTELIDVIDEVGELTRLKSLHLSLHGPGYEQKYRGLPSQHFSEGILSKLENLEVLSIVVQPEDYRWMNVTRRTVIELVGLKFLRHLRIFFRQIEYLRDFITRSPSWRENRLKSFDFVVGNDKQKYISLESDEMELKYSEFERCLRYVNGDMYVLPVIKEVLGRSTSFCLEDHKHVQYLAEFGIANIEKLKFCCVKRCPKVEVIVDEEVVFQDLQCLGIHFLFELQRIWKVDMPIGTFPALKVLTVYACIKLKFVFPGSIVPCLSNLEELVVHDCDNVMTIVQGEVEKNHDDVVTFPRLRKVVLCFLPELVTLGNGIFIEEEYISVRGCPRFKLENKP